MKFQVGQLVKVKNNGETYCSYSTVFKELGFNNTEVNNSFKNGTVGQIFAITKHTNIRGHEEYLCALVDEHGNECLIGENGINPLKFERVEKPTEVKLNIDYTAKVYRNKIEVGCQTITKEAFVKLVEAAKQKKLI